MPPPKKRPATSPPATDDRMQKMENELKMLNQNQGKMMKQNEELVKKQEELMKQNEEMKKEKGEIMKQNEKMTEIIKELQKQATEPKIESYIEKFPIRKKTFKIKHTFKNVSTVLVGQYVYSDERNFYGMNWRYMLNRTEDLKIGCYLYCSNAALHNPWTVETETKVSGSVASKKREKECRVTFTDGVGIGFMQRKKTVTDEVSLEVEVTILKMEGVLERRKFDDSHREFSDVVLTVDGEDFYVLKKILASRSLVFNAMFFSNYEEAKKDQIDLKVIDARDFQNFLETVYGESTIEDSMVEGLVHLADYFISPYALKKCEKFLLKKSKMPSEKKYELSKRYKLDNLMNKCISEMTDVGGILAEMNDEENTPSVRQKLGNRLIDINQMLKQDMQEQQG